MVLASASQRRQTEEALDPLLQCLFTRLELFRSGSLKRRRRSWEDSRVGRWFQALGKAEQQRAVCIQDKTWVRLFLEMAKKHVESRRKQRWSSARWKRHHVNTSAFSVFNLEESRQVLRLQNVNKRIQVPEYVFRSSQLVSSRYEAFAETLAEAQKDAASAAARILESVRVYACGEAITFSLPQGAEALFDLFDTVSYFNFLHTDWTPPATKDTTFARTPWFDAQGWVSLAVFLCNRLDVQLRQCFVEASARDASKSSKVLNWTLHNDFRFAVHWNGLDPDTRASRFADAAKRHSLSGAVRNLLKVTPLSDLLYVLPEGSSDLAFDLLDASRSVALKSVASLAALGCLACRTTEDTFVRIWDDGQLQPSELGLPFIPLEEYVGPLRGLAHVYIDVLYGRWQEDLLKECLLAEQTKPEKIDAGRPQRKRRKKRKKKQQSPKLTSASAVGRGVKESNGTEQVSDWLFQESSPFFGAQLDIWSDICNSNDFLSWRPVKTAALQTENGSEDVLLDKVISPSLTATITSSVNVGTQTDAYLALSNDNDRGRDRGEEEIEKEKEWTLISKRRRRPKSADVRAKEDDKHAKHHESSPRSSPGGTSVVRQKKSTAKHNRKHKQSSRSLSFSEGRANSSLPFSPEAYTSYPADHASQTNYPSAGKEETAKPLEEDATKAAVEEVCKHFDQTVGKLHQENAELRALVEKLVGKMEALELTLQTTAKSERASTGGVAVGLNEGGQMRRKSTIDGSKQYAAPKGKIKMMPEPPMKMMSESNLLSPSRKAGGHHHSWAQDDFDVWQPSYLSQNTTLPPASVYYSMSPPSHYAYFQHQHHNAAGLLYTHPGQVADMSFLASPSPSQSQTPTQVSCRLVSNVMFCV